MELGLLSVRSLKTQLKALGLSWDPVRAFRQKPEPSHPVVSLYQGKTPTHASSSSRFNDS